MLRKALYFLFFLVVFLQLSASEKNYTQSDSVYYAQAVSIEGNYGFIIPHHYYINYLIKSHIPNFNIEYLHRVDGSNEWHHLRHLPYLGGGLYYANLGNPDILGNVLALYGKVEMPVGTHGLSYSINAGISYLTKTFVPVVNNYNTCISSHLNVYFQLAFLYRLTLSNHWEIFPKINITHYSNGNFKEPNTGLNVASIGLISRYRWQQKTTIPLEKSTILPFQKWQYRLFTAIGSKATTKEQTAHFLVGDLEATALFRLNKITAFNGGIDYFYDGSVKSYLRFFPEMTFSPADAHKTGFHLGYEPFWGKTSISIEMGYYLFDKLNIDGRYFHRVGLNHHFSKHLLASISLKTHFFKAEYVEWRLGYEF